MIIPVRCYSCGRVIASDYMNFKEKVDEIRKKENRDPTVEEIKSIFEQIGVRRYCCKRMIISHIDLIDEVIPFD
ncbi:MAG: DNA-directed RNA polymerase subunit N [Thermoplasmata archaeon]